MGLIDRLASQIATSEVPLTERSVRAEAERLVSLESPLGPGSQVRDIADRVLGLGPLEWLLRDASVSDVLVNGPDEVWVERDGAMTRAQASFPDAGSIVAAVDRVIAPLGLRVDRASPFVDARLPDGSRLHAVVPPASVDSPVVAIRRFTQAVDSLDDLIAGGSATQGEVEEMRALVAERETILISGGTGTGKTTLLNLLAAEIPIGERIVSIEDAAELTLKGHVVRLEAHPPNAEGAGEITIRSLLRSALRLRPDRIIVGEVRGPEALDLITALNTGHRGSMSTIHANSPEEALWRLETLAMMAGDTAAGAVKRQLRAAVGAVVQLSRHGNVRKVDEVTRLNDG